MNKGAGTAVIRLDPRSTIAERLPAAVVRELEPDEAMADVVREIMASDDPPRVLSVYGGDGSVSRMADLALEFDLPFLPLPGGTFNHFSRTAGIESVDLAIDALQAGSGIAASVGELTAGGRTTTVLNSASIASTPSSWLSGPSAKPGSAMDRRGRRDLARAARRGADRHRDPRTPRPRLVGLRQRRPQHPRPGRDVPAAHPVRRRPGRPRPARPRIAPAGGGRALVRALSLGQSSAR